jgi:hypothetical protein
MKILLSLLLSLLLLQTTAQPIAPPISEGTQLSYRYFLHGQTASINVTVKSVVDTVRLDWNLRGAAGSYLISKAALQNGTKINFIQPENGVVLKLADDETFGLISKTAFALLKKNKRFVYNNTTYALQNGSNEKPLTIGNQTLDVLHVAGVEEAGDMWILNNPTFPLIVQFSNNPLGINFVITGMK